MLEEEGWVVVSVRTERAYDQPGADEGYRVLVDGLWPRGVSKQKLKIAEWMRDLAPSRQLRQWYGHQPEKWEEFRRRFRQELDRSPRKELLEALVARARKETVTLVFGARDAEHSNATVIAERVREKLRGA